MNKIPIRHIHESLREPEFTGEFSIRSLAELLGGKDMVQDLHRHSFYYIMVLATGEGNHSIDFMDYPVQDNTIFFMRPGQVHELTLKSGATGYLIAFTKDFYPPFDKVLMAVFRKVNAKNYCRPEANRFARLLSIMDQVSHEHNNKSQWYTQAIRSGLDTFFIELARQSHTPDKVSDDGSSYMQERLEELQEWIALHLHTHKQVSYYANKLNITSYQLNAITKSTLGKTGSEVINEAIILEAKRNLLATSYQVNQIAYDLGYEDPSYFIRFFKKHTGHSPDAFRRNFK